MSDYKLQTTQSNPTRRNSFCWGLKGYRSTPGQVFEILKRRVNVPFNECHTVRDEARWLAMYCCDEDCNMQFLMEKTKLRRPTLKDFCQHYGIDLKRRDWATAELKLEVEIYEQ